HVHAAIGFGEELFGVASVFRIVRRTNTERDDFFSRYLSTSLNRKFVEVSRTLQACFWSQSRSDDYEFVAAHTGDIVVFAARLFQLLREHSQEAVAFEVSEAVVHLFESIEIADQHCESFFVAAATGHLSIKV